MTTPKASLTSLPFSSAPCRIANNPLTTAEIKAASEDLKVLGKRDFKNLLKWRVSLREQVSVIDVFFACLSVCGLADGHRMLSRSAVWT